MLINVIMCVYPWMFTLGSSMCLDALLESIFCGGPESELMGRRTAGSKQDLRLAAWLPELWLLLFLVYEAAIKSSIKISISVQKESM